VLLALMYLGVLGMILGLPMLLLQQVFFKIAGL